MSVPATILRLIRECGGLDLPGTLAETQRCEGAKFHSPQPLLVREHYLDAATLLAPEDSHDSAAERVWLCGTCHSNLIVFLCLLQAHKGRLPWEARREFGNLVRALGFRAWTHHLSQQEQTA